MKRKTKGSNQKLYLPDFGRPSDRLDCIFRISEGPLIGCTVPSEIQKVQWNIQVGKGPENILRKIGLEIAHVEYLLMLHVLIIFKIWYQQMVVWYQQLEMERVWGFEGKHWIWIVLFWKGLKRCYTGGSIHQTCIFIVSTSELRKIYNREVLWVGSASQKKENGMDLWAKRKKDIHQYSKIHQKLLTPTGVLRFKWKGTAMLQEPWPFFKF